jgi:ABC-2 type transport system ATP-binding protein
MTNEFWAELSGVSKRFGKTVALDGLDLQVRSGELLAVLGPNGAGKTTAISLLLGLRQPDSGSARLFGKSPLLVETRRQVGVMMQEAALAPELRVREQVDLVASYYPSPLTTRAAMRMAHIESLGDRPYDKLSGGQKRQAQFAMAICGRPKLLFLDEPTAGLDLQAQKLMWTVLRQLVKDGSSIILTTHHLEEAEALADRVAVLAKGHVIASGSVNEMRALVARKHISCSTTLAPEDVGT